MRFLSKFAFIFLIWLFAIVFNGAICKLRFKQQNHFDFHSSSESMEFNEEKTAELLGTKFEYRTLSACHVDGSAKLTTVEGGDCSVGANKVATGRYRNAVNETGWGILEVETFSEFEPEIQAYAAGVVEGVLTKLQIYYHHRNTIEDLCKGNHTDYCKRLFKYLSANLDWIRDEVSTQSSTNVYWRQVNLTYTQLTGIFHGYTQQAFLPAVNFHITPILLMQLLGDFEDLDKFLKKDPDSATDGVHPAHCSAIVKVTEGNRDLFASHVTWAGFNGMNRVLKLYKFAYDKANVPGNTYAFSSYPATLTSTDDYTLTNAGLLSMETSISIFNNALYSEKYMKSVGQLQCWVRSVIANQLSKTGAEWVETFARYNSGTYNNQWTIVDYKLFKPGQKLPDSDLVWIVEQIPGFTQSEDITWFLRNHRYWPSYNIPYLPKISRLSGYDSWAAKYDYYSWRSCPRAKIFERDQHKVIDLESLKNLMRYNDYRHDEYSRCKCNPPYTAAGAISTRGDLNPANGTYEVADMGHLNEGSTDYKGTNYQLFRNLQIHAIGGPTYDPLPPFK